MEKKLVVGNFIIGYGIVNTIITIVTLITVLSHNNCPNERDCIIVNDTCPEVNNTFPEQSIIACNNTCPEQSIIACPKLKQYFAPKGCKYVKHLSHDTSIVKCNNFYVIGRRNNIDLVGIKISIDEFNNICKAKMLEREMESLECIVTNKLSDFTDLYLCPDNNYILQNNYTIFLSRTEYDRICKN